MGIYASWRKSSFLYEEVLLMAQVVLFSHKDKALKKNKTNKIRETEYVTLKVTKISKHDLLSMWTFQVQ